MNDIKKDNQIDKIEEFFLEVIELPEYKNIEYLVFSIRIKMLQLLSMLKNRPIPYECPYYLKLLANKVSELFDYKHISCDAIWDYMCENDNMGWIIYFNSLFEMKSECSDTIAIPSDTLFNIITCYILDTFREKEIDIAKIRNGEKFIYDVKNDLTLVSNVKFENDSFIYDGKAYLYNIFTNTSKIDYFDTMPGFAKIITDEVKSGDILLRVDERLAVPKEHIISYTTLDSAKFHGPQFHFKKSDLKQHKTIIVHIDEETNDKLLMVIKQDEEKDNRKAFWHIEIETIPSITKKDKPCQTIFIHGKWYPDDNCFNHIDYEINQYPYIDYIKKYAESDSKHKIDFYATKEMHYKIWCIENGNYSLETWYKLVKVSLPSRYHKLLDEILK